MSPVEFLVLTFPGERLSPQVVEALANVRRAGDVRVIDSLVMVKSITRDITTAELADLDYLRGVIDGADAATLIGPEDAEEVAGMLPPGTVSLLVLVEHLWLGEAAEAVHAAGGRLAASVRVPAKHVEEAVRAHTGAGR